MGVTSILLGVIITRWLHICSPMILGCLIFIVGSGTLAVKDRDTSISKLVGYQVLVAIGSASGKLCPTLFLQNIVRTERIAHGLTILTFLASLGG